MVFLEKARTIRKTLTFFSSDLRYQTGFHKNCLRGDYSKPFLRAELQEGVVGLFCHLTLSPQLSGVSSVQVYFWQRNESSAPTENIKNSLFFGTYMDIIQE